MTKTDLTFLRPLVVRVLSEPFTEGQWTVQGFGFLRTYFGPRDNPKKFRLNVWDSRFTVPNVSTIHDHPWDLTSLIIAGHMTNERYIDRDVDYSRLPKFSYTTIKTGVGGGLERGLTKICTLEKYPTELYSPGDSYRQHAEEIHETKFLDGSVTLNERIGDTEHARVFWPAGTEWVDAIPRPATRDEVISTTGWALGAWF